MKNIYSHHPKTRHCNTAWYKNMPQLSVVGPEQVHYPSSCQSCASKHLNHILAYLAKKKSQHFQKDSNKSFTKTKQNKKIGFTLCFYFLLATWNFNWIFFNTGEFLRASYFPDVRYLRSLFQVNWSEILNQPYLRLFMRAILSQRQFAVILTTLSVLQKILDFFVCFLRLFITPGCRHRQICRCGFCSTIPAISLPSSSHGILPVYLCLSSNFSFTRIPVMLDQRLSLFQYDLILN